MIDININELLTFEKYDEIKAIAQSYVESGNLKGACECYKLLAAENPKDILSRFMYAQLVKDGTHIGTALARDIALHILNDFPEMLIMTGNQNVAQIVRFAAEQCRYVGPIDRALELYQKLVSISYDADDFYALSEILAINNEIDEAGINLKIAIMLKPEKYANKDDKNNLEIIDHQKIKNHKLKIGRYPKQEDFLGDLKNLIVNHIAVDLKNSKK